MGNRAVFKRLGYIVEILAPDRSDLINACRTRISAGISPLDPDGPPGGHRITRWGLRVNVDARSGGTCVIPAREVLDLRAEWSLDVGRGREGLRARMAARGHRQRTRPGSSWVFKGGTCLSKCYFETYRFSEDLDFTVIGGGAGQAGRSRRDLRPDRRVAERRGGDRARRRRAVLPALGRTSAATQQPKAGSHTAARISRRSSPR